MKREGAKGREGEGANVDRRTALKVVAAAPFLTEIVWSEPDVMMAHDRATRAIAEGSFVPKFFTASEWKTVRVLTDLIMPRDARSGSATDVGVPEFMDFMMIDKPNSQKWMREGLAWLDTESQSRFGHAFIDATSEQQSGLLTQLAWPKKAPAELKKGVDFFISFRNLTLTGFWTTKVGIADLQYSGNTYVAHWNGCPPEALKKLGVSYGE